MTEEIPVFLEEIVFEIVDQRTKLSSAGSVELRDIVALAADTRSGTTREAVQKALYHLAYEGMVDCFDHTHYRVPLCVAEPDAGV